MAWELRKLGELASKTYGGGTPTTSNDEFWNGTIPWIQSSDLIEHQVFGVHPRKYITKEAVMNSATKIVPENALAIITRVGVGKLAVIPFSYTTSQDFLSLSELKTDVKFTAYLLYKKLQCELIFVQGTSIKGITKDELLSKIVFVPERKEQEAISAFFANLDNLITLHQRKLDKMKELKKAFLNLIFSQKLRFEGFTDSWELRKLGEVAPLRGGYAFQSNQYANEGIPIVRISNILSDGSVGGEFVFHNELKDDEIFMLENGDIVLAMSGATTGKVSILSSEKFCKYYQNQRVGLFSKTATCNYSFVATIVRSEKFLEQLRDVLVAGAQPNVSAKDIDAFDFSVPKDVEEQSQIGNFFRTLDRLITLHQKKIDSLKEMKKILLKNMLI
ncbi:restriction endonuclease subunit S [Phascolarctobacterium faecium]|uniref:restriction endonuclease subunit S n=1 Tax=Phascolarctobacterium faecium TaxID=33025 RepID=UPI003AEF1D70